MIKRRNSKHLISRGWLILFAIMALTAAGCNKKESPPPPQATPLPKKTVLAPSAPAKPAMANSSTVKPAIQKQISTAKKPLPSGGVGLDFTNRRDPFKPYIQVPAAQQGAAGKSSKGRLSDPLPIQSFDTEKFKITGIITGLKQNSALVMDPAGKGYVIREGMQIGNNDGYVKKVTTNSIEVEESFRDDSGKVRKRIVKLTLLRKK
jgi:type IV pilus assembly protein PilP